MLLITTALLAEARPIIQFFRLKPKNSQGFRLWENDSIRLIISGTGKAFSAAATGYLFATCEKPQGCINIGVAGHKTLPVGTPILADKIQDDSSPKSFYPSFVFQTPCITGNVLTVDCPQKELSSSCQDMEASTFYMIASKFLPVELIHVLKVVSDNADSPHHLVTEKRISEWIENACPILEQLIHSIVDVSKKIPEKTEIDISQYAEEFHFTLSQKYKLQDILERIDAFKIPIEKKLVQDCNHANEICDLLESKVKEAVPVIKRN